MTLSGLALAIVAVWWPAPIGRWPLWALCLLASVLAGLWMGVLSWPALLPLAVFMWLGWRASDVKRSTWWVTTALGLLALALALHAFPWFQRVPVFEAVRLSPDAPAFALFASVDKALAGLGLLAWVCRRCTTWAEAGAMWRQAAPIALASTAVVLGLGVFAHAVHWDPKWPPQAPAFLAVNLLFTCVAEEAFFRGLLQERLMQAWRSAPMGAVLPGLVSAVLFGAVHLGGGWPFALLAGVAGLGYATAYARTRRIEAAILTHFALNATHFLLFTYPARA
ncbi:MAG TPA: CPBP family intramembrane glutamic endopeptidase [Aquabacterium sp.]|uniref:CPBP family intramembrane glutamic endopeptidase n=1 Tax=Aquabacterium sp. TaxID=1872578 RepID=UPI002E30E977|nr:CPBP family intramembrane glutamic endopeptidase [Aquabacterium sp.]HEX5355037.1 CPBP family intramembrane glutamic endopeptidase [Aquabacterium sp.]